MNSAAPDKRYHRWGQGASPAYSAIRGTTKKGELVLDPFCGGGTTAAVCVALGRRFLTFDDDPEAIRAAKDRLAWADLPLFRDKAPAEVEA
jgi:site-specific DNA-methyltransferase (adenine-specific)